MRAFFFLNNSRGFFLCSCSPERERERFRILFFDKNKKKIKSNSSLKIFNKTLNFFKYLHDNFARIYLKEWNKRLRFRKNWFELKMTKVAMWKKRFYMFNHNDYKRKKLKIEVYFGFLVDFLVVFHFKSHKTALRSHSHLSKYRICFEKRKYQHR